MSSSQTNHLVSLISYAPGAPSRNQPGHSALDIRQQEAGFASVHAVSPGIEIVSAACCSSSGAPPQKKVPDEAINPVRPTVKLGTERNDTESSSRGNRKITKQEEAAGATGEKKEVERPTAVEVKSALRAPTNPLRKKKTVAFGRTTNVSQTVEGIFQRRRIEATAAKEQKSKMASGDITDLKEKVREHDKKFSELQQMVEELQKKDIEKEEQILKLTEMVKALVQSSPMHKARKDDNPEDKPNRKSGPTHARKTHRGKENFPPEPDTIELQEGNEKWMLIKRKCEEDPDFRRYIDEGIMRFGGDVSLAEIARSCRNYDTSQKQPYDRSPSRHCRRDDSPIPLVKTTRVTKQMTVEQIQHSPARSLPFSYDTKKYLARHGVVSEVYDDGQQEDDQARRTRRSVPVESLCESGESVTYYDKRSLSPARRDNCYTRECDGRIGCRDNQKRRGRYRTTRSRRALEGDSQHQIDEGASDSEELLDEAVDIEWRDIVGSQAKSYRKPSWRGSPTEERIRLERNLREGRLNKTNRY